MTDISANDDVIDSRDVIARIEELRDNRMPFVAGWNMCGYMPDAEPGAFSDIEEARGYIEEELESRAEQMREEAEQLLAGSLEGADARQALLEKASELEQAAQYASEQESAFSVVVGGFAFWVADAENGGLDSEEAEELAELEALFEQASSSPDWEYGEQLISRDYFVAYIEELIDDCYEMPKQINSGEWPWRHMSLDIEAAAKEAESDYFEVEFFGRTFLIRA